MKSSLTKEDLSFITSVMDEKFNSFSAEDQEVGDDGIGKTMSVPKPVEVDVQGTMSKEDYDACAMVMAVCTNMVQKTITDAAQKKGIKASDALKNMDAWVQGFVDFPFPFFTFKDSQSNTYSKDDFSLKADPDAVAAIVNIKNVANLKDAVLDALKASNGNIASYSKTEQHFKYFGVITAYNDTDIATRVIKFDLNMKKTDAKALCVTYAQTNIDSSYVTYNFTGDKDLMIKMQAKMGDEMVDYFAEKLLQFLKSFYDDQLKNFNSKIADILG